ncbi:AT-rich interactive domain-containing protein 1A isoform X2 [Ischnura elegans]|uniref:AT-rich interactive domain-containing protein 1A isoform X2 n=1 Tax=Ischnura elegans TaxID=197161 RepID=UPI001ED89162|nr:AT-rich interactive domain-containing protein 1A isoform X2 [Ischnura elegans]
MLKMSQRIFFNTSVITTCLFCLLIIHNGNAKVADNAGESSKRISKRNEVDLQFCVENFDIQADTIIRTQDSRAMGAKYINETDLSSRDECLKLCCETTSCDVFVFEEKNPGSCYLFNCGPSDDFKCKFDQHTQYTSAILAVSRHAAELESEIQHSKHEQELTRLRAMPNEMVPSTPGSPVIVSTQPPPPKEVGHPVMTVNSSSIKPVSASGPGESVAFGAGVVESSSSAASADAAAAPSSSRREKCSRYQFECRSTGECIAIYNACDGIPQCADGSDEGSELDCPSTVSTSPLGRPRGGGQEETGHLHNHPHQQQKAAAVTTAGTHPITAPPPLQVSSQAMAHHIPPAIEGYMPVRGPHTQQSVPLSVHQMPAQPAQFQPNWEEQQQRQQQQQVQLPSQYHSVGTGYSAEDSEARPPQYPSQHLPQQPMHMGYPGDNFPLPANGGLRERPPAPQGSGPWPPVRSEPQMPPSPLAQEWFPHPPNDGSNMGPRYEEGGQNRHIFNHKGSGLVADSDSFPYGESNQGDYNAYANGENKNYVGGSENYFSTPYRQPVQTNWPLMHQKMASDPRQMGEPVKDPREEIARKHSASVSSMQSLPHPNSAHSEYPSSSMQSLGGGEHPAGVPIPPDYFYEDGPPGGRHSSMSSPHRGSNYQRNEPPPVPIHSPELVPQKSFDVHHETPSAQHVKQKIEPVQKEVSGGDEEEGTSETGTEEGGEPGQSEKPAPKKPKTSFKHEVIKPSNIQQHQSPVHMSIKHEHSHVSNEDNVPDGESGRPKGAVLSLTLGMVITAIMIGLMAWRIRVIKRRWRRGGGKSPYAHDADYLLNGMYL